MKSKVGLALAATGLCLAFANPASADIVTLTVTGTVTNGFDGGNLFGVGGGSLAGDAFKVVYTSIRPAEAAASIRRSAQSRTR